MSNVFYKPQKEKIGTEGIFDLVFKDSSIKYGLQEFPRDVFKGISFFEKEDGKVYVKCLKRNKDIFVYDKNKKTARPEEIIRQLFLIYIRDYLKYPLNQLNVEEPIQMGSDDTKRADIVIFTNDTCTSKYIIIELKKPDEKEGIEELESYMNATGVKFGAWSNGSKTIVQLREEDTKTKGEPFKYRDIPRLPKKGEYLKDILKPLTRKDLKVITNLKETIQRLEEDALANAGVSSVFDELFKLFFAKLHDEFDPKKKDDSPMQFRVPEADPDTIYEIINGLFQDAKKRPGWGGIFDKEEVLKLKDDALIKCASTLEPLRFHDADLDVIDAAFEYLINPEQKGQKGQYFTPRMVVDMCVKMMDPQVDEKVIDPACGSAGFLIHTIKHIREQQKWGNDIDKIYRYASNYIFAVDFDDKLKKVAKVMMLIAGDGKSNVFGVDSLDFRKWAKSEASGRIGEFKKDTKDGDFDIVLTNPPFSGKITGKEQLSIYELYDLRQSGKLSDDEEETEDEEQQRKNKKKKVNSMKRDILFIERCLRFLKPGGRMAIVLPQGNLNNIGTKALREWIMSKAKILAVVGLGVNTFKPFTGTKTSVLFLQKWGGITGKPIEDYPIFMATSERSGKDSSGNYILLNNREGKFINNEGKIIEPTKEKPIVDNDLNDIVEAFTDFCKKEGIKFN
ncbi:MAG: N-6 DNA methylase [bacterium]|nr:N-6 DNA methylase [bacterium]